MSSARRGGRGQGPQARGALQSRSQNPDERIGRQENRRGRGASLAVPTTPSGPRNSNRPTRGQRNGLQASPRSSAERSPPRAPQGTKTNGVGGGNSWAERYQTLKKKREQERRDAIAQNLMQDPNKPRSLADAITLVGTCPDMCPEFERVQRVVEREVNNPECDPKSLGKGFADRVPLEERFVKKFRRSAAGMDEQLPSDLRPPAILQKTVEYLFNKLLPEFPFAEITNYLWDRTRAVRNDFSIQQVRKLADVRIAIDCFERIVRFHLLSLHQMARDAGIPPEYSWKQDHEQMEKALYSLVSFYDDNSSRYRSANEAEIRAYQIIFCLGMKSRPTSIEDTLQGWPSHIIEDSRVQRAIRLYKAGSRAFDENGPLRPPMQHSIARQNWEAFWDLLRSNEVSYLMACAAEIGFYMMRDTIIRAIFRTYRQGGNVRTEDWTLTELVQVLGFDEEEEVQDFCQQYGFTIAERADGTPYLDLTSVRGQILFSPASGLPPQKHSRNFVEFKRQNRTLPAIIMGLSIRDARKTGLIEESEDLDLSSTEAREESLFVTDDEEDTRPTTQPAASALNPFANAFKPSGLAPTGQQNGIGQSQFTGVSSFGKPSGPVSSFGKPTVPPTTTNTTESGASSFFSTADKASPSTLNPFSTPASGIVATGASSSKPATSLFSQSGIPPTAIDASTPKPTFEQPTSTFSQSPLTTSTATTSVFGTPSQSTTTSTPQNPAGFTFPPIAPFSTTSSQKTPQPGLFDPSKHTIRFEYPATSPSTNPTSSPTGSSLLTATRIPPSTSTNQTITASPNTKRESETRPTPPTSHTIKSQLPLTPFGLPTISSSFASPSTPATFNFQNPIPSAPIVQQAAALPSFTPTVTPQTSILTTPPTISTTSNTPKFDFAIPKTQPSSSSASTGSILGQKTAANPYPQFNVSSSLQGLSSGSSLHTTPQTADNAPPQSLQAPDPQQQLRIKREKDEALDSLAKNMMWEPTNGILQNFIEFTVHRMFPKIQAELEAERDREKADNFRQFKLAFRYGRRWHALAYNLKVTRRGRERRQRMKLNSSVPVDAKRRTAPTNGPAVPQQSGSLQAVTTIRGGSEWDAAAAVIEHMSKSRNRQSQDGVPSPHRKQVNGSNNNHRRSRTQPDATRSYHNSDMQRNTQLNSVASPCNSRFGYTFLSGEPTTSKSFESDAPINATETHYFRLKTMGINPESLRPSLASRKRSRTVDDDTQVQGVASRPEERLQPRKRLQISHVQRPSSPPRSVNPARSSVSHAMTDEERFARYRAVKEALNRSTNGPSRALSIVSNGVDGTTRPASIVRQNGDGIDVLESVREIYQAFDETERFYHDVAQELKQSRSKSPSDHPASVKQQLRSSFGKSHGRENGVPKVLPNRVVKDTPKPAYWGRVSRFVPRELYGKGIQAVREGRGRGVNAIGNAKEGVVGKRKENKGFALDRTIGMPVRPQILSSGRQNYYEHPWTTVSEEENSVNEGGEVIIEIDDEEVAQIDEEEEGEEDEHDQDEHDEDGEENEEDEDEDEDEDDEEDEEVEDEEEEDLELDGDLEWNESEGSEHSSSSSQQQHEQVQHCGMVSSPPPSQSQSQERSEPRSQSRFGSGSLKGGTSVEDAIEL